MNSKAISQSASTMVALAATVMIVAFTLAMQLPGAIFVQRAAVEEAGEAEKMAGVKLSLVALIDGRAIIANDGTAPVTIKKLITPSGVTELVNPITIQPGQKVSVIVGNSEALAVELEGTGSLPVVLKKKPGLQVATATWTTDCCITTRYVATKSTTLRYTSYTPYYVTATQLAPLTTRYTTTTITHRLTNCILCYYSTTLTYTSYYYYTPYAAVLSTATRTSTVVVAPVVATSTRTSVDTTATPWTIWYITEITSTLPSVTTVTTTTTPTVTLPTYTTTAHTTTVSSALRHTLTSTSVVIRPTATTTTTATLTHTVVRVS
ncbi:MAG: hypothetical protein QXD47_08755 [Candidatus Caldarchaeum sp.]